MELHSYAKRRAASKKWTTEHKRKLVEARIEYDGIFSRKPTNCLTTWKKITILGKLDEFNVNFVRKQWSNMLTKYKQFKKSRLGSLAPNTIDDEMLRKITQEWEFFYPIHCFMSRKLTHLHSYALTQEQEKQKISNSNMTQKEQNDNNLCLASQLEAMMDASCTTSTKSTTVMTTHDTIAPSPEMKAGQNIATFSSDTNDDYAASETVTSSVHNNDSQETHCSSVTTTCAQKVTQFVEDDIHSNSNNAAIQNTDHDFYSKKSPKQSKQTNGIVIETIKTEISDDDNNTQTDKEINRNKSDNIADKILNKNKFVKNDLKSVNYGATCSSQAKAPFMVMIPKEEPLEAGAKQNQKKHKRSERDNYYKHKRRFNRRLERRFDALLNVFGQIVKAEYPNIDASPLFGATAKPTANGAQQATFHSGLFDGATLSSDQQSETEVFTSNDELSESQGETTIEEE